LEEPTRLAEYRDFDAALVTADAALERFGSSDDAEIGGAWPPACLEQTIPSLLESSLWVHKHDLAAHRRLRSPATRIGAP